MLVKLRLWGPGRWLIALGIVVAVVFATVFLVQLERDRGFWPSVKTAAPAAGALAAILSLVATSISLAANWRRQRRLTTLDAWRAWSDATIPARRRLTRDLGMAAFSKAVGEALAGNAACREGEIDLLDATKRKRLLKDLAQVLNGLERLAVGVDVGIYDADVLRRVGGTIIVRQWSRSEAYIEARRELPDEMRRQEKVFTALEGLASRLESQRLREASLQLDKRRLRILSRSR